MDIDTILDIVFTASFVFAVVAWGWTAWCWRNRHKSVTVTRHWGLAKSYTATLNGFPDAVSARLLDETVVRLDALVVSTTKEPV